MNHSPLVRASAPQPGDPVADWFEPLLAERLAQAGMHTLGLLVQRINAAGARWWYPVRGMGVTRATRVVEWLRMHQSRPGLLVTEPACKASAHSPLSLRQEGPRASYGTGGGGTAGIAAVAASWR